MSKRMILPYSKLLVLMCPFRCRLKVLFKCGYLGRGKGPCGRPHVGTFLYYSSMFCRCSLWLMATYRLLSIFNVRFVPHNIHVIWVGTCRPT